MATARRHLRPSLVKLKAAMHDNRVAVFASLLGQVKGNRVTIFASPCCQVEGGNTWQQLDNFCRYLRLSLVKVKAPIHGDSVTLFASLSGQVSVTLANSFYLRMSPGCQNNLQQQGT